MTDGRHRRRARDSAERRALLEWMSFEFAKADARKVHARVERGRVILPPIMRQAFLAGERPAVTTWGREPCPIKPGMEYRLANNLKLVFTEIRRNAKGHHRCVCTVQDFRPVTLRTRPSDGLSRRNERQRWSPEEEHGYSRSTDALDAGDVLDPVDQREEDEKARVRAVQGDILAQARRERYDLETRLAAARSRADEERIDISSEVRVIQKRIQAIERRVFDKAA